MNITRDRDVNTVPPCFHSFTTSGESLAGNITSQHDYQVHMKMLTINRMTAYRYGSRSGVYVQMWRGPEKGPRPGPASLCFRERFENWESRSLLLLRLWLEDGCCCCGFCCCCWYRDLSLPISLSNTSCSTKQTINWFSFHSPIL